MRLERFSLASIADRATYDRVEMLWRNAGCVQHDCKGDKRMAMFGFMRAIGTSPLPHRRGAPPCAELDDEVGMLRRGIHAMGAHFLIGGAL